MGNTRGTKSIWSTPDRSTWDVLLRAAVRSFHSKHLSMRKSMWDQMANQSSPWGLTSLKLTWWTLVSMAQLHIDAARRVFHAVIGVQKHNTATRVNTLATTSHGITDSSRTSWKQGAKRIKVATPPLLCNRNLPPSCLTDPYIQFHRDSWSTTT